eukprot:8447620-Pyramimonas_sp.AAC.1
MTGCGHIFFLEDCAVQSPRVGRRLQSLPPAMCDPGAAQGTTVAAPGSAVVVTMLEKRRRKRYERYEELAEAVCRKASRTELKA